MIGKRLTAMILALGMVVTAVAGCGNAEQSGNNNASDSKSSNASDNGEVSDNEDDADDDDDEAADITVALMSLAPVDSADSQAVEDKINEITESEINVHVNLEWYDGGTYGSQVPMMIQGGDKLDLMMFIPVAATFTSLMGAGQLMDITDLLDEYGQDIKEVQGDMLVGCSLNGRIYGVGNYGDKAAFQTMLIRTDVLEEVGRLEDAKNATSWPEIEDIMKDVTAAGYTGFINNENTGTVLYPNGFLNGSDQFSENHATDTLGDGYLLVTTDPDTDTVNCKYFTDDFKKMIERVAKWYNEGLVYKDAGTAQDYGDTLLKSDVGVAKVAQTESGGLATIQATTGHEFTDIRICNKAITTESCTKFGFGIPVTATEPEAAMKFLNLLYTSQEMENTLTWGIEGRDWVLNDEGYATYPDGVTAENVQYHTADFLYGNQFLITQWEGSSVTREEQKQATADCPLSKYFGFQIDNTGLENTLTACYNVEQQYIATLMSGSAGDNWEATLTDFQNALKAAGIDDLIAAYQEQLDNWLAQQ